ncbi:uncharacterized protein LOC112225308 isoform X2 [Oncorhynchus tshawytscha]|uniref:uncharacterized protein LOC112225308 isoform X2 n=1 Tax=Oncorhynchus tshawytscha TaxID=74940 RepID=UPI001C3DD5E4|nr:uncharacterized protein LOC112225308 isoform X2 [Oncorhynchus tshawytscha]
MEFLKSYKEDLCKWLSTMDAEFIIDKCDDLLTAKQDKAIRNQKTDPGKISLLLETFIEMEESTCQDFLKILKDEQTHYPGLQQHFSKSTQASSSPKVYADCNSTVDTRKVTNVRGIKDLDMHVTVQAGSGNRSGMNVSQPPPHAEVVATKHSHIFASEISNCTIDGNLNMSVMQVPAPQASQCPGPSQPKNMTYSPSISSISDKRGFLKRNRTALVSQVKNVKAIVDDLQSGGCHDEMAAIVNAQLTPQEMMRKLLDSATSTGAANALIQALLTHQKDVMDDLIAENA